MESQFDRDEVLGKGAYLGTIGLIQLVVRSPSKVIRDPFNKLESARHPDLRGNHNNNRTGKSVGRITVKCSKYHEYICCKTSYQKESILIEKDLLCVWSFKIWSINFLFSRPATLQLSDNKLLHVGEKINIAKIANGVQVTLSQK